MRETIEKNQKIMINIKRVLVYIFLIVFAIVCVVPFYVMLINATRASADINGGLSFIPGLYLIKNWVALTDKQPVLRTFLNSAIISISVTILVSYFSALTAYGFTVYDFKGKSLLFTIFVMAVMLVPLQLGLIGFYTLCNALNMLDTYWPLIIPAIASPFGVFFLRQYMTQVINDSVIQAGRIDGAGELGIFHRIILPIVMPGVATNAIFSFVASWNNYITPLIIITTDSKKTLPMMLAELATTTYRTDFGVLYLAVAVSVVPILVLFAVLSKRIMESVAIGGNKE